MRSLRGYTLVEVLVVATIIMGIAVIAVPHILSSKKIANEGSAVASLKVLITQQALFKEGDKDSDDKLDYADLNELATTGLVDEVLGAGRKAGYTFAASASTTSPTELWFATATPVIPNKTGDRYFATNQTGVIYYRLSAPFPLNTTDCKMPADAIPFGE